MIGDRRMNMGYHRSQERNRRLKKLYDETKQHFLCGAFYDDDKNRYVKYSLSDIGQSKYYRNLANRKVRHSDDIQSGGSYRKAYDYWWALF